MSIESLAALYVNFLEPAFRVILFVVIIVVLLYFINVIRDSKKKTDIINSMFSLIVKVVMGSVKWAGKIAVWLVKVLLKTTTVIYASIRDFFISKI